MNTKELLATASFTIFRRGKDYYDNNMISSYSVDTRTESIAARVKGTTSMAPYEVRIELDSRKEVSAHSCSCPFDREPLCKHEVAVLLAAIEGVPRSLTPLSYDFAEHTTTILPENESEHYRATISELVDVHMPQNYLDDEACWALGTRLRAEFCAFQSDTNHSRMSVLRYTLEMLLALDRLDGIADDYHGGLLDLRNLCLEGLREIVDGFSANHRDDDCFTCYQEMTAKAEGEFSIDLQEPLYEIISLWGVLDNGKLLLASLKRLADAEVVEQDSSWYHVIPTSKLLYYHYLKMFDLAESQLFLASNLDFPEFRKEGIEVAIAAEDFAYAEKLCLDGIAQEDNPTSRKNKSYYEQLVHIYTLSNSGSDQEKLVRAASTLCLEYRDADHYETLKNAYDSLNLWEEGRESVLTKVTELLNPDQATRILLNEAEWRGALLMVQNNLRLVYHFFEELNPYFPQEVEACFKADIKQSTRRASSKGKYDDLCKRLLTMTEACGAQSVLPLIEMLKTTYKQRRNMLKDLHYLEAFMKYKA